MRKFLFADEAGCFNFSKKQGASKYYILTSIALDDPCIGDELLQLRRDLSWANYHIDEFHASMDKQWVRNRVYERIQEMDMRIDATIYEKSKAQPHITKDSCEFYKHIWYFHMKHVAPKVVPNAGDELQVSAAAIKHKRKNRAAFKQAVDEVAKQVLFDRTHIVAAPPSASDPCLQIADYCCWAFQRAWELGDGRPYALIEDKIETEFDMFSKSKTHYY